MKEVSKTRSVYCIDIPGEPGKSDEKRYPLTDDSHINWLDEVIRGLGLPTTALVGISLGGWMSAAYAIRYPQKVEKLVLEKSRTVQNVNTQNLQLKQPGFWRPDDTWPAGGRRG